MAYGPGTALIVVDVQNDFAHPSGSLFVRGGDDAVAFVNEQIRLARRAGSPVICTQDWHPGSTPHFEKDGGVWPVHCVAGTWGAELHADLDGGDARVFRKGTGGEDGYSGFTVRDPVGDTEWSTGLEEWLGSRDVETVVVVGLATDYCVKETALDAVRLGFAATVVADAIRAVDLRPGDGARAVAEMTRAGVVVT